MTPTTDDTPPHVRAVIRTCLEALNTLSDEELGGVLAALALTYLCNAKAPDPIEQVEFWCRGVVDAAVAERMERAH